MLNCTDKECILHHHHYYHGHYQHHLQDHRAHHEHPTHHPMSGEADTSQDAVDAVIQGYLNDTDSELSSLSHLDAPSDSVYVICGVLIAMIMVAVIIILLAVTISKLRKREESSGIHRSNVVHPESTLQTTVVVTSSTINEKTNHTTFLSTAAVVANNNVPSCVQNSISTLSLETNASYTPQFLYSSNNSQTSLSSNDQETLVHPVLPADECANKKNLRGKLKKLVKRKSPPDEVYTIPVELRDQLKQIYVY